MARAETIIGSIAGAGFLGTVAQSIESSSLRENIPVMLFLVAIVFTCLYFGRKHSKPEPEVTEGGRSSGLGAPGIVHRARRRREA